MSRIPSRKVLQDMDRRGIQKLCKDHDIKANLKTETLIDLLVDVSKTTMAAPATRPRTASLATKPPSRKVSGRSRGPSKSSVVFHESDQEDEEEQEEEEEGQETEQEEATMLAPRSELSNEPDAEVTAKSEPETTPPPPPLPPVTRTRKAKEQTRLGVGRPAIAGGTGARAVTKSISLPKRGRVSRTMVTPSQDTIMEEVESSPSGTVDPSAQPASSGASRKAEPAADAESSSGSLASLEAIDKRVADALRPLYTQMSSLKSEVERLKAQVAEIPELQRTVRNLATEVEELRRRAASESTVDGWIHKVPEDLPKVTQPSIPSPAPPSGTPGKMTPGKYGSLIRSGRSGPSSVPVSKSSSNGRVPSMQVSGSQVASARAPSNSMAPAHPGFAAAVTGKRRRDSEESNITGVFEQGHEDEFSETELEKRVPRPTKKRAKLDLDWTAESQDSSKQASGSGSSQPQFTLNHDQEDSSARRAPPFTIFTGPDEPSSNFATYIDPPPPTNPLPDFFAPSNPPDDSNFGGQTSTANAEENQSAFGFNFLPMTSTPMQPMYPMSVPNFPYPEPPTSPSPAGERTYQPFGHSSSSRPRSGAHQRPASREGADGSGTVNPAALGGHRGSQEPSSDLVGAGLGLASVPFRVDEESLPAPGPAKTMYGTERDTRFGDFGVEGVATGFWTGAGSKF